MNPNDELKHAESRYTVSRDVHHRLMDLATDDTRRFELLHRHIHELYNQVEWHSKRKDAATLITELKQEEEVLQKVRIEVRNQSRLNEGYIHRIKILEDYVEELQAEPHLKKVTDQRDFYKQRSEKMLTKIGDLVEHAGVLVSLENSLSDLERQNEILSNQVQEYRCRYGVLT